MAAQAPRSPTLHLLPGEKIPQSVLEVDMARSIVAPWSTVPHLIAPECSALPTTKRRLALNLDDEEYRELALLAESNGLSMAWIGRRAIVELLKRYRESQLQLPLKFAVHSEWDPGPR